MRTRVLVVSARLFAYEWGDGSHERLVWYICSSVRAILRFWFIYSESPSCRGWRWWTVLGLGPSTSSLTTISIGTGILIDKNWNKVLHSLPRGRYRQFSCRRNEIRHWRNWQTKNGRRPSKPLALVSRPLLCRSLLIFDWLLPVAANKKLKNQ